jgi:hypothetical protein
MRMLMKSAFRPLAHPFLITVSGPTKRSFVNTIKKEGPLSPLKPQN